MWSRQNTIRSKTDNGYLSRPKGFATKANHGAQEAEQWKSMAVVPPIFMSSTYKQHGPNEHAGFIYSRIKNPTRDVLERCLASLDNGKYGLAFSSGLGAITAIITMLKSGDHVVAERDLYAGTNVVLVQIARKMNIAVDFIDLTDFEKVKATVNPTTRMFWVESPTNPLLT